MWGPTAPSERFRWILWNWKCLEGELTTPDAGWIDRGWLPPEGKGPREWWAGPLARVSDPPQSMGAFLGRNASVDLLTGRLVRRVARQTLRLRGSGGAAALRRLEHGEQEDWFKPVGGDLVREWSLTTYEWVFVLNVWGYTSSATARRNRARLRAKAASSGLAPPGPTLRRILPNDAAPGRWERDVLRCALDLRWLANSWGSHWAPPGLLLRWMQELQREVGRLLVEAPDEGAWGSDGYATGLVAQAEDILLQGWVEMAPFWLLCDSRAAGVAEEEAKSLHWGPSPFGEEQQRPREEEEAGAGAAAPAPDARTMRAALAREWWEGLCERALLHELQPHLRARLRADLIDWHLALGAAQERRRRTPGAPMQPGSVFRAVTPLRFMEWFQSAGYSLPPERLADRVHAPSWTPNARDGGGAPFVESALATVLLSYMQSVVPTNMSAYWRWGDAAGAWPLWPSEAGEELFGETLGLGEDCMVLPVVFRVGTQAHVWDARLRRALPAGSVARAVGWWLRLVLRQRLEAQGGVLDSLPTWMRLDRRLQHTSLAFLEDEPRGRPTEETPLELEEGEEEGEERDPVFDVDDVDDYPAADRDDGFLDELYARLPPRELLPVPASLPLREVLAAGFPIDVSMSATAFLRRWTGAWARETTTA